MRLVVHDDGGLETPTAWCYRVARNVIIDHYRTRRSNSRRQLDAGDLASADPAEDPSLTTRKLPSASSLAVLARS